MPKILILLDFDDAVVARLRQEGGCLRLAPTLPWTRLIDKRPVRRRVYSLLSNSENDHSGVTNTRHATRRAAATGHSSSSGTHCS